MLTDTPLYQINAIAPQSPTLAVQTNEHGQQYTAMPAPIVLFRSVSPEEWEHIAATQTISGGLNRFNPWDRRREVFFGAVLNDKLIGQGEDVARRGEFYVQQSPLGTELKEAIVKVDALLEKRKARSEKLGFTLETTPSFLHRTDATLKKIAEKSKAANADVSRLRDEGRTAIRAKMRELRALDEERGYSSVVLETRPIGGGRVYSGKHSGMGADEEYGFESGAVGAADIARIRFISHGKVVRDETYVTEKTMANPSEMKPDHEATRLAGEHVQNVLRADRVDVFVAGRAPLAERDSLVFVADQAVAAQRAGFGVEDQAEKYAVRGGLEADELDDLFRTASGSRAELNVREAATHWAKDEPQRSTVQIPLFVEQVMAKPVTASGAEDVAKALRSGRVRSFAEAASLRPTTVPSTGKGARR